MKEVICGVFLGGYKILSIICFHSVLVAVQKLSSMKLVKGLTVKQGWNTSNLWRSVWTRSYENYVLISLLWFLVDEVPDDTHYGRAVVSYSNTKGNGYSNVLFWLSPLQNEENGSPDEDYTLLTNIPEIYGKAVENVIVLIVTKFAANRTMLGLFNCSVVGCARYCFNLAVDHLPLEHKSAIRSLWKVMKWQNSSTKRENVRAFTCHSLMLNSQTR